MAVELLDGEQLMGFVAPHPRRRGCYCGRPTLAGEEYCALHLRTTPVREWMAMKRRERLATCRCEWCGNARPSAPLKCPDCGGPRTNA